jgi:YebC/PmpR family DNA-binding regulatory protein
MASLFTMTSQFQLGLFRAALARQVPEFVVHQRRNFAGHSKWANIRHKKGAKDVQRAALFGKASRAITVASRACGGDLTNLLLQGAIAHAKSIQLPKDRIEDAIAKATSKSSTDADLIKLRFDAMMTFGGTKVACIVTALADNRNRATQQVRATVSKLGGELLPTDKLAHLFVHVGQILVEAVEDEDELLMLALDAGATNIESEDDNGEESNRNFVVTTDEKDLWQVVTSLRDGGFQASQFEHRYVLVDEEHGGVDLSPEGVDELEVFLERMDENEDVNNVYHNAKY